MWRHAALAVEARPLTDQLERRPDRAAPADAQAILNFDASAYSTGPGEPPGAVEDSASENI